MLDGMIIRSPNHSEPTIVTQNECLSVATVTEWAPLCEDDTIKPSIERIFGTLAEAEEFYNCYARLAGFNVRKGTSLLDKNRELVGKYFLCSKQGLKEDRKILTSDSLTDNCKERKKRSRGYVREMCKAMRSLKKIEGGHWVIANFHEGHSHDLTTPRNF